MDKQNVAYRYNGVFFSLKKEGNSALSSPATKVFGPEEAKSVLG